MAELTNFILGSLSADFMSMKTADNVYLKDIIKDFADVLADYNSKETALSSLFCHKFVDENSNFKRIYANQKFSRLGEDEKAPTRITAEVWNYPIPIQRFGGATQITMEQLMKMKAEDLYAFHNANLVADKKLIITEMFRAMLTKAPGAYVDALDGRAIGAKAFWNADGVDIPRTNGQNSFLSSHNHYLLPAGADNTFTITDMKAQIAHITEHENMGNAQIVTFANTGATLNYIKAMTEFRAVNDISSILGLINPAYQQSGIGQALITGGKILGFNVKVVGTVMESIVVECQDVPAKYIASVAFRPEMQNQQGPLGWREHPSYKGLFLYEPNGNNPLVGTDAQYRRWLGLGVEDRSAGAVTYTGSGVSGTNTWAEPTFA
jgi:hypothetical protein